MRKRGSNNYNNDWKQGVIQRRVRSLANHQCECCHMRFMQDCNYASLLVNRIGRPLIGTVHHLDYDRSNDELSNLVYLCQRCHIVIHVYGWKPGMKLPEWRYSDMARMCEKRGIPYETQLSLINES